MPPHPLNNFEMQGDYQIEPKSNGVYSRNNLPKIKDGAYAINHDEWKSVETDWIALYVNSDHWSSSYDATYFDGFGGEHILKEIKKFIGNKKHHNKYL